mgnify:CR=1 FL=1
MIAEEQEQACLSGHSVDRVPQPRLYRAWTGPNWGSSDAQHLALAAAVLAGDKNSRLYQRLVYADKLVDRVSVEVQPYSLASQFVLTADIKPGVDPAKVEAAFRLT